jgi:hypothetical protein
MRNLFQKPIIHYTFVLTVVAICCGLLIGAVNAVTAPIIEENRRLAQLEAYQSVMPDMADFEQLDTSGDPSSITDKVAAYDENEQLIGYIFVVFKTNSYGPMRMVVSVSPTGVILGAQFIEIVQTLGVPTTRHHLSLFVGTQIANVSPAGDIEAGVTGSYNTLKEMLQDVSNAFANLASFNDHPSNRQNNIDFIEEVYS